LVVIFAKTISNVFLLFGVCREALGAFAARLVIALLLVSGAPLQAAQSNYPFSVENVAANGRHPRIEPAIFVGDWKRLSRASCGVWRQRTSGVQVDWIRVQFRGWP